MLLRLCSVHGLYELTSDNILVYLPSSPPLQKLRRVNGALRKEVADLRTWLHRLLARLLSVIRWREERHIAQRFCGRMLACEPVMLECVFRADALRWVNREESREEIEPSGGEVWRACVRLRREDSA